MWRAQVFPVILLVPTALLSLACGGGGGGGGGSSQPPPTVPETLAFSVSPQWFDASPGLLRHTVSGAGAVAGQFTTLRAEGTYNRITQATTLTSLNLALTLTPDPLSGSGTLTLGLMMPDGLRWTGLAAPTAGTFQFNVAGGSLDFDRVNMTVTSAPGVTMQAFLGVDAVHGPDPLGWAAFEGIADDAGAPAHQRLALLGYQTWRFLFRQTSLAYTGLETVVTQDAALQARHTVSRAGTDCPALPGAVLEVTWQDVAQGGELGVGDSFRLQFTRWWLDVPGSGTAYLHDGILQLSGYTEEARIIGGDFEFQDLSARETESGALSGGSSSAAGGFNFTLSWN